MPATETAVVSGRVPVNIRNRVDKKLDRKGITPSELILRVYNRIDRSDDLSWLEEDPTRPDENPIDSFLEMVGTIPANTRLATMTIDEYKEKLADRG